MCLPWLRGNGCLVCCPVCGCELRVCCWRVCERPDRTQDRTPRPECLGALSGLVYLCWQPCSHTSCEDGTSLQEWCKNWGPKASAPTCPLALTANEGKRPVLHGQLSEESLILPFSGNRRQMGRVNTVNKNTERAGGQQR